MADSRDSDPVSHSGEPGTRSRVEQLRREAIALPTDERRAFLEENCGSNGDLRAETMVASDGDRGMTDSPRRIWPSLLVVLVLAVVSWQLWRTQQKPRNRLAAPYMRLDCPMWSG